MTTVVDQPGGGDVVEIFEPPPSRRPFSPGDVLRLLVSVVLIVLGAILASAAQATMKGLEEDLVNAFGRLPDTFESAVLSIAQLGTSLIPLITLVVLLVRGRWKVALVLVLTGVLAFVAMTVADVFVIDRDLEDVLARLREEDSITAASFPNSHVLATTTAVVTVAAPWLTRRWKHALWWSVGLLVVLRLLAIVHPAFDVVLAVGIGLGVGSLVLLVFGRPSTEPSPQELLDALRSLGLRPRRIERQRESISALRYRLTDPAGAQFEVSLRTPDETDADLLNRVYRGLRFRAPEVGAGYATLKQRIEHEALVLTLAERHAVRVPALVAIGTTVGGSAFVVTRDVPTRPLIAEDLDRPSVVDSLWTELGLLHNAGIAHRRLTLEAISVDDDGNVWLHDFDDAETAAPDRELARDVAELLTETAVVVGPEAAVAAAVSSLGPQRVAPSLRMLQPLALPPATRARAKAVDRLLDDLRDAVNQATGEPGLGLEELERIKPRTLLIIVASTFAFYSLLPQLANLSDTVDAFGDARLQWIVAALVASAITYVFAAVSFQGAVADPIPFVPNLRVQLAAAFTGLVGPGGAGGFALTARFLQRVGVGGPESAAAVAVKVVGGFAVHISLLIGFVLWSGQSDIGGFSLPDTTVVLLVVAIALALLGVLFAIGPVRERFFRPALTNVKTGVAQIGQVFRRPGRVAALFGGAAGLSLTYVVALVCCIEAFGGDLTFAQVGAAYLVAVAIATFAPTPGGLGALESALIAGLTGFGLPDGIAVSSVLSFRLATFWLPVLPGWLALGWMQRNDEV
ncbi:MAG TPA: lysylphosphatidylglycerol synthase domain-containing protein [Desertimonas sp.]|nr:lysylphosphatidylglycerol synthase domain-containing protein [Desertimonas sp.]